MSLLTSLDFPTIFPTTYGKHIQASKIALLFLLLPQRGWEVAEEIHEADRQEKGVGYLCGLGGRRDISVKKSSYDRAGPKGLQ